jgi:N-acetyl-D-muramate 6-phosphate phosphatase
MPLDLARIRALCFDIDGTLSDTDDLWVNQLEKFFRPLKRLFPQRQVRPFARWTVMGIETPGNTLYHFLDHLDLDDKFALIFSYLAQHGAGGKSGKFQVITGVTEMLDKLVAQYPLAVVSARDEQTTLAFLEHFNLRRHFTCIATAQTCRHTKPFADQILWAAEKLNIQPSQVLMVGDTTVDIHAGKTAGSQTVGVLCGFGSEYELLKAGADLIIPSTAGLPDILL